MTNKCFSKECFYMSICISLQVQKERERKEKKRKEKGTPLCNE
jgi:hypothetical protein